MGRSAITVILLTLLLSHSSITKVHGAVATNVILSELLPNPDSPNDDANGEYVELFNPTTLTIDVSNYELCDSGGCKTIPSTTTTSIASGQYLLICRNQNIFNLCDVELPLDLKNGGGDTVTLKDSIGATLDVVTYGSAKNKADRGYVRGSSDDTTPNWSWSDVHAYTPGTGSLTTGGGAGGGEGGGGSAMDVILSEMLPDPAGTDTTYEFIELYNPTATSIDLSTGYEVCDPTCRALSGTIAPGEYFLICRTLTAYASCDLALSIGLTNGGDTVSLKDGSGTELESVSYTSAPIDQSYVRQTTDIGSAWAWSGAAAYTPGSGSLSGGDSGGSDGGGGGNVPDTTPPPTPGATPNPTISPPSCPVPPPSPDLGPTPSISCASHILISQVLYDEPLSATNKEWVELYNPTSVNVDIGGWTLNKGTSSYTIPFGATIYGGGRFILGKSGFLEEYGFEPDVTDLSISLTNSGAIIQLMQGSTVVDEVGWETGTGAWSTLSAGDGMAIRRINGGDSNNDATDWESNVTPIPGGRFYACSGKGGGVGNGCFGDHILFGKIYYDTTAEEGSAAEFIELYNPTKAAVDLTGYTLNDNSATTTYTISSGIIPSLGRFIIAKSGFRTKFPSVTPDKTDFSLTLNDSGDQLYLRDATAAIVDFVAWEGGATDCGTDCIGWDIMAGDGQYLIRSTPVDTDSPNDWARVTSGVIPGEGRPTCGTPSCIYPSTLTITAVDIGQGDMSLVATPTKLMLGDTGESTWNTAYDADTFDAWFRSRHGERCLHLDYVVISHFQVDHIGYVGYGGLWKIHNVFKYSIGKTLVRDYQSYVGSRSGTYDNWVDYLDNQGGAASLNVEIAIPGAKQIDLEYGTVTTIVHVDGKTPLSPCGCRPEILAYFDLTATSPPSENDYSVAFTVSLGDFDMFIGGDTSGEDYVSQFGYQYHDTETCLKDDVGEVDVYRVNHHGSDHSTNAVFVAALKPQVAVISVGDTNPYGHPRQVVMDRLNGPSPATPGGVEVYMTQRGDTTVNVYNAKVVSHCDVTVAPDGSSFTVTNDVGGVDNYTSHPNRRRQRALRGRK